jgi:hypothetical protein
MNKAMAGAMAQVVENLPYNHEALNSNPISLKKKSHEINENYH